MTNPLNTLLMIILIPLILSAGFLVYIFLTTPKIVNDDQPRVPKNYPRECEKLWDETEEFYNK